MKQEWKGKVASPGAIKVTPEKPGAVNVNASMPGPVRVQAKKSN